MLDLVWLIPAFPLAGFLLLVCFGRRLGDPFAGWLATIMCGGSFLAALAVFVGLVDQDLRFHEQVLFSWIAAGEFRVDVGFLVDPLAMTMVLFITGIASLIHLYAIGYMHADEHFSKFFIYLNLFVFAMLMLVLGNNLLMTFLGWEGVGACSYFLISFWFTDEANASAGKKAFVTNRVGDFGFMVATFLVFATVGSIRYVDIFAAAPTIAAVTATGIVLMLFVGAAGKSAQLPLYVWLPDAMAGPTPVSALIHAATMVTAGVYLMIRMSPVIASADSWAPDLIAWVGAATALFAATIAVAQNDIKKVLAYSTVSQLGYLFLAVGVGGYTAAIFHMVTHAFFKALLFLAAGSVIHGMHHEQDMRRFGGLAKLLPLTCITFIVGWLAIAGVPPFSGFWSKDEILAHAWQSNKGLWAVGFVTALLTAFYMSRQVFLTFFGRYRFGDPSNDELNLAWDARIDAAQARVVSCREGLEVARVAVIDANDKLDGLRDAVSKAQSEATAAQAAARAVSAADLEAARAALAAAGDDKDAKKAADRALKDLEKPAKDAEKAQNALTKAETALASGTEAVRAAESEVETQTAAVATADDAVGALQREAATGRPRSRVVSLAGPPEEGAVAEFLPHDVAHRREYHPHESPITMLLPLFVLAGGAIAAGVLNLPFSHDLLFLEKWLEPSFFGTETALDLSGPTKTVLAVLTAAACIAAIGAAGAVYLKGKANREAIEQPILARAWGVDEAYAAVAGGPGRKLFAGLAAFDRLGIDGAVNGTAAAIRGLSGSVRKLQTGFVRSYALGIAIGAAALVALFLSRASF